MSRRKADRTRHRAPCAVTIGGRRHNGFLIDYSTSGMFIQTSASPKVGQRLDLELTLRGERLPMHVEVVRRRSVPAQLRTLAGGGIGVRILSAPESFYALIAAEQESRGVDDAIPVPIRDYRPSHARPKAAPGPVAPPAPPAVRLRFRVRVRATQSNRSRTLDLEAQSESEASRLALEELGSDWKVLEVSSL
jgi:hypothetical protein